MKFVCIIGDNAVGKMTVGQELEKLTGFSLFHNHMTIEIVLDVFKSFYTPAIEALRKSIFESFTTSNLPGLIFTLQLAFELKEDIDYLENLIDYFKQKGIESYIVELDATLEERLKRNRSDNRLEQKASKRDIELSEQRLMQAYQNHRCISKPGEIKHPNFLCIENTHISAQEAAKMIKKHFDL